MRVSDELFAVVKERHAMGAGIRDIVSYLNSKGYRTANGKPWYISAVWKIVQADTPDQLLPPAVLNYLEDRGLSLTESLQRLHSNV